MPSIQTLRRYSFPATSDERCAKAVKAQKMFVMNKIQRQLKA